MDHGRDYWFKQSFKQQKRDISLEFWRLTDRQERDSHSVNLFMNRCIKYTLFSIEDPKNSRYKKSLEKILETERQFKQDFYNKALEKQIYDYFTGEKSDEGISEYKYESNPLSGIDSVIMGGWEFFVKTPYPEFDENKVGKWMYFSNDSKRCREVTLKAVQTGIVSEAKYSYPNGGVCCFYLQVDDMVGHRRVIEYFLQNDMIQRTKTGKLYNISFKLDVQTEAGEYGDDYKPELQLGQFMNLETGKWIGE